MPSDHPRYKEKIIGTGEPVWQDIDGNPNINKTEKAYQNILGELVSADTPDAKPAPAIGWKIDLKNTDGTPWLNDQRQPGWSTYTKHIDAKPVFTGREYPLLLPKVAATLRNIQKKTRETLDQTPEESLGLLQSDPEKYGAYLLTSITHHLEKWLKKGPNFGTYHTASDISLAVLDNIGAQSRQGIRITQGNKSYKIVSSEPYTRDKGRHAWSIYIDTTNSTTQDISQAQNFKLLPVGKSYFEAKICLDTTHYTPLSEENRALLKFILILFKSL